LAIPLAWFIFCCTPLILLRPWLAHDHSAASAGEPAKLKYGIPLKQVIICSLLLTSCDIYLEPISVYTGYWTWVQQGHYFGAPILNFLGWFWVGLFIYSSFFYIQRRWFQHAVTVSIRLDSLLMGLFLFWVFVALMLIGYEFNTLLPLLLTSTMIVPFLYLRMWKGRQIRANAILSTSEQNGTD
jgi:uncharacterized membrane protein